MPELPDLEVIRQVLAPELTGQTIAEVKVVRPLVVRDLTLKGFAETLAGQTFADVLRRGKILLFPLESGLTLAINCKLAGRLQYALPDERRHVWPQEDHQTVGQGGTILQWPMRITRGVGSNQTARPSPDDLGVSQHTTTR